RIEVNDEKILPEFLYIFLKTKCGRMQIERFTSGSVQRGLYLESIKKIKIPSIEISNQKDIILDVKKIYECIKKSKEAYEKAKLLVKKEVHIDELKIIKKKSFIKKFSEVFENERIDADYYRLDYENLINQIKNNKTGYVHFNKKNIRNKNFIPSGEKRYNYVELADINSSLGLIEKCLNEYGANLPTRARRFVNEGDVIVSSIEGSLKSSAIINSENDGFVCSNGFFVLKSEEYSPEFLLVLMKNNFIQLLLKRGCSGTILSAISSDELMKIPLPIIDKIKQTEVVKLVKESHRYYYEAKDILKKAIIKVEKNIGIF
ncbi:MAG: hypothetical protein Q7S06_02515, partial [Nanoarchaeota archaeon]|nr:hypothetical protein [Nanoarchaeota archaeon]